MCATPSDSSIVSAGRILAFKVWASGTSRGALFSDLSSHPEQISRTTAINTGHGFDCAAIMKQPSANHGV
jgi:hypothetical protein